MHSYAVISVGNPIVNRTILDSVHQVAIINANQAFDFSASGVTSGTLEDFQFFAGFANSGTYSVTPFVASGTAGNFTIESIGTTRTSGIDFSIGQGAVSFDYLTGANPLVNDDWVVGIYTEGENQLNGQVVPFDIGVGETSVELIFSNLNEVSLTTGAFNAGTQGGSFINDNRTYSFAITAEATAVPEASHFALFAGLAVLSAPLVRRKLKKAK